jgi:hypothetical protein
VSVCVIKGYWKQTKKKRRVQMAGDWSECRMSVSSRHWPDVGLQLGKFFAPVEVSRSRSSWGGVDPSQGFRGASAQW